MKNCFQKYYRQLKNLEKIDEKLIKPAGLSIFTFTEETRKSQNQFQVRFESLSKIEFEENKNKEL